MGLDFHDDGTHALAGRSPRSEYEAMAVQEFAVIKHYSFQGTARYEQSEYVPDRGNANIAVYQCSEVKRFGLTSRVRSRL